MSNEQGAIGTVLKKLRKARGLSQMALAEKIGVSYQQIQKYEKGTSSLSVERLKQLAAALEAPVGVFLAAERDRVAESPAPYETTTAEERLLLEQFRAVKSKRLKRAVLDLVKELAQSARS